MHTLGKKILKQAQEREESYTSLAPLSKQSVLEGEHSNGSWQGEVKVDEELIL